VIVAGGGDDRISHLSVVDRVCAGPGNDGVSDVNGYGVRVRLGGGDDRIDLVHLPYLFAGPGDDVVVATLRDVTGVPVHLGPGDDLLRVRTDPTRPPPRYGEVCIDYGGAVRPIHLDLTRGVARGEGRDRIVGVSCVRGSPGRDYVVGSPGSDYIEDWRGSLHVDAVGGDDFVNGSRDDDVVMLGSGRDTYFGYGGDDLAYGGTDMDELSGEDGIDTLYGGPGDDRLAGGPFCGSPYSDPLRADGSPNALYGGLGEDLLVGDIGNDLLDGGPGVDRGFGQDDGLIDTLVSLEHPFYCR
jgi:Ca2+-binding RTX toxin-like protein